MRKTITIPSTLSINLLKEKLPFFTFLKSKFVQLFIRKKKKTGREFFEEMAKLSFSDPNMPRDLSSNDDCLYSKEAHYGTYRF